MNRKPRSASRFWGGCFHSIDSIAPAPTKPTAPQARTSSNARPGWKPSASTVVPPTSIGASTVAAALRWNRGIADHTTSPAVNSHADATAAAAENRYCHVVATAFDAPVVPEVKNRAAMSSGSAADACTSVAAARSCPDSESPTTSTRSVDPTRCARSLSVTTNSARDSRNACVRNSPLLAAFTAAVTAPMRAAASQKYTHSGQVPVNNATVCPRRIPSSARMLAAAQDLSRICSNVTGVPAIDIMTRSPNWSARRSSTDGTVNRSTPNDAGLIGITRVPPPGREHRRRCTRSLSAMPRRPDRTGAPIAAARRSLAPLPVPGWAFRGTSCSPR